MKPKRIIISEKVLLDLVHWSRRYADGRMTSVPSAFNRWYAILVTQNPELMKRERPDDSCKAWPWALDGSPTCEARPEDHQAIEQLLGVEIQP